MAGRNHDLPGHNPVFGRRDVGARHHGGYHRFHTIIGCQCGWTGREIQIAPSLGGRTKAVAAHRGHIVDVVSRDAMQTYVCSRTEWRPWQPGDGARYVVRTIRVGDGPDYGDRVLLVNIGRCTWALQFPVVEYRREEMGTTAERRALLRDQVPEDVWNAALPLLTAAGVV